MTQTRICERPCGSLLPDLEISPFLFSSPHHSVANSFDRPSIEPISFGEIVPLPPHLLRFPPKEFVTTVGPTEEEEHSGKDIFREI